MTKTTDSRELALDILMEIMERGAFSHVVLGQALSKYQYLDKQERAFITRVVEGTLEYQIQIDYVLEQFSSTKLSGMKPFIRTLLRMSVYQILHMDRVPDSAVCNEAVKLAAKRRFGGLKGFVNGVLRNVSRRKEDISFPDDSIRYSVPSWMLELWKNSYGQDIVVKLLEGFLKERSLTVRCNYEKAAVVKSLNDQGVAVSENRYFGDLDLLELAGVDYLEKLDAFQKGWITVQDASSALAAQAAGIKEGGQILDVCGAPGGKALHAARLLHGTGHVLVRDISERKVQLIRENVRRCGFANVTAQVWDALTEDEGLLEREDVVFADLPCSGLGVLGRKPDIKNRVRPEDLKALAELQRQILSVVCRYVKPGGVLVYSTCTIDPLENEENLRWFLDHYPFEPVDLSGRLGENLQGGTLAEGYVQLLPGIHPCDGFFLSVMRRQ